MKFLLYKIMICMMVLTVTDNILGFIFNQSESGYVWENIFSFPTQIEDIGLGNVNNSLKNNFNCININPALGYDIYYKQISILYSPLSFGSDFSIVNYSMPVELNKLKFPLSFQVGKIVSGEAERVNIFGESYGYKFRENFLFNTIAFGYYLQKYDINLGFGIKNVYQNLDEYSAYGTNLDLGFVGALKDNYVYGISWLNIFPINFGTENTVSLIRSGINFEIIKNWFSKIELGLGIDFVNIYDFKYLSFRWGIGGKISFFELPISITGSAGYYGLGFGINFIKDNINFGYGINYNLLGLNHKFGITYKFNFYPEEYISRLQLQRDYMEQSKKDFLSIFEQQNVEAKKRKEESLLQQKILLKLIQAKEFYENKNYLETKKILLEILKLDSNNEVAKEMLKSVNFYLDSNTINNLYIEAKILYEKNKYLESINKLNKILELDEQNVNAKILLRLCLAQQCINLKKFKEAKSELFEVLKLDLNNEIATELLKKVETLLELE